MFTLVHSRSAGEGMCDDSRLHALMSRDPSTLTPEENVFLDAMRSECGEMSNNSPAMYQNRPWRGRLSPVQGLLIETGNPQTEVFINDSSYGAHDILLVELAEGRYNVRGARNRWCEDYEETLVEHADVTPVSVRSRRVRLVISHSFAILGDFAWKRTSTPGWMVCSPLTSIGFKFGHNYLGAFGIGWTSISRYNSVDWSEWQNIAFGGIVYGRAILDLPNIALEPGVCVSAWKISGYFNSDNTSDNTSESIRHLYPATGPSLSFKAGWEHFKFISSASYHIKIGARPEVISLKNYALLDWGIAWIF
jgi:hypothetical protein